jgi:hypothetical protein
MSNPWLWALGLWLAMPVYFVFFPKSVRDLFIALGLVERSEWSGVGTIFLAGIGWVGLGVVGAGIYFLVLALRSNSGPSGG